ncbi:MAG: type II secretion system F family protein [Phycisphaerales bacterium]|nr:type II secretion system F family protein [Phycisphaerales bacterium]
MPTFRYESLAAGGAGTVEAADRASAVRELLRRGVTPSEVVPLTGPTRSEPGAPATGSSFTFTPSVMSRAEMATFIRELATAVQAGLPLVQGLRTIASQLHRPRQKAMLTSIIDQVEHGRSLGDAAETWGRPFTDLTVNLIRSGEVSGRLPEVLLQAADLLDRDVKMRRSLLAALLYPLILLALISAAIVVIVTVIVPQVLKSIEGVATLPLPTRIVQGFAAFLGAWGWAVVLGIVVVIFLLKRTLARPGPRLWVDTQLLRVPILGRLLRDVAVARFTRTLGTLTAAGIPVLAALRTTRGTLGNKAMERVIDDVAEQIAAGRTIAEPLQKSGYFPPMLVQIVSMGERSGRLDQMLSQAAGAFEDRTETSLKLFTTALPPLLVALMAGIVGFIVLAILLPMLEMQDAVGKF